MNKDDWSLILILASLGLGTFVFFKLMELDKKNKEVPKPVKSNIEKTPVPSNIRTPQVIKDTAGTPSFWDKLNNQYQFYDFSSPIQSETYYV